MSHPAQAAPRTRVGAVRARVRSWPGGWLLWRIGVTVVGVAIVVLGVILLPLPGPGWLIIFGGLGVLATEYAWAARLLRWARDKLREWTTWLAGRSLWIRALAGVLAIAFVVGVGLAVWYLR